MAAYEFQRVLQVFPWQVVISMQVVVAQLRHPGGELQILVRILYVEQQGVYGLGIVVEKQYGQMFPDNILVTPKRLVGDQFGLTSLLFHCSENITRLTVDSIYLALVTATTTGVAAKLVVIRKVFIKVFGSFAEPCVPSMGP